MKLVWQCVGDEKTCALCASLDGLPNGTGWSSTNGSEIDLWVRNKKGEWERGRCQQPGLYGEPPLHPNCRCSIVVHDDGGDVVA